MIITLCGSTSFKDNYREVNERLTLAGHTVFSVGIFARDFNLTEDQLKLLDKVHRNKIDLSEAICVINRNAYTGDRTDSEIEYALEHKKKIIFAYFDLPPQWYWLVTANKVDYLENLLK